MEFCEYAHPDEDYEYDEYEERESLCCYKCSDVTDVIDARCRASHGLYCYDDHERICMKGQNCPIAIKLLMEEKIDEYKETIDYHLTTISDLEDELDDKNQQIDYHLTTISDLEDELDDKNQQIEILKAELAEKSSHQDCE